MAVLIMVMDSLWPAKCKCTSTHNTTLQTTSGGSQNPHSAFIIYSSLRISLAENSVSLQIGFNYLKTVIY